MTHCKARMGIMTSFLLTELRNHPFEWIFILFISAHFLFSSAALMTAMFYALLLPAAGWYLWHTQRVRKQILATPALLLYALFFGYLLFHSVFIAPDIDFKAISNTLATACFCLCATLFFAFSPAVFLPRIARFVALSAGVCSILSILVYVIENPVDPRMIPLGRADTQVLAAFVYVIGAISAFFAMGFTYSLRQLALLWLSVLLCGATVLLTQSRMALLVYAICLAIGGLYYGRRVLRRFAVVLLVVLPVFVFVFHHEIMQYWQGLWVRGDSYRLSIWQMTWEQIQLKPWTGYGMQARIQHPVTASPHNIYLSVWFMLGLPALLLLLALILHAMRLLIALWQTEAGWAVFSGLLLLNSWLSGVIDHSRIVKGASSLWIIFWLAFAVTLGLAIRGQVRQIAAHPAVPPVK